MERTRSFDLDDEDDDDKEERTKCEVCLSGCKQMATFTLSHIGLLTLVICYCSLGAAIFEKLEAENERKVKENMTMIRRNVSLDLWEMTKKTTVIVPEDWKKSAREKLKIFEEELINAMRTKGWDGSEDQDQQSWDYLGSLFYSIIVITTIGYGHIAPKTMWGKIVTILYAIVGIPLMVICWSHIGDFLANAFRFLYWKVCCYICTKNPRRPRGQIPRGRRSMRAPTPRGGSIRMKVRSIRRSQRASQRSAESAMSDSIASIASDPGVNYTGTMRSQREQYTQPVQHASTLPRTIHSHNRAQRSTKSVEPELLLMPSPLKNLPVLYNRYAEEFAPKHGRGIISPQPSSHRLETAEEEDDTNEDEESDIPRPKLSRNRMRSVPPEIQYTTELEEEGGYFDEYEDDDYYEEDCYEVSGSYYHERRRQVPIWLCAFLVVGYIVAGGFLFSQWEGWLYLDSAYFCFITLTTIGFGDFVPAQNLTDKEPSQKVTSIGLCSLYLLFGIALLAMSFNLVQEQVINAFKDLAMRLGIIPDEEEQYR